MWVSLRRADRRRDALRQALADVGSCAIGETPWSPQDCQGDIVVENDDIFGDGVNIAARLEGLAEPGGICVSARVQEDAAGRLDLAFEDMGEQTLKNIARPVRAYRVVTAPGASPRRPSSGLPLPDKQSIAVLPFANMSGDPEQEYYFADGAAGGCNGSIAHRRAATATGAVSENAGRRI
jgi:Adenylate and Guanylate cyclase catalytic domain